MMRATVKIEDTRKLVRVLEHLGCDDMSAENRSSVSTAPGEALAVHCDVVHQRIVTSSRHGATVQAKLSKAKTAGFRRPPLSAVPYFSVVGCRLFTLVRLRLHLNPTNGVSTPFAGLHACRRAAKSSQ